MAELYGRVDGVSKGWGGSMHLFDVTHRLLGGYGIVGGQLPLATGAALAIDYRGGDEVVMCHMGDGTTDIGAFHESLNIAALWKLPVVYVIVNNGLGMGTTVAKSSAEPDLYKRGAAYRMESARVDGIDLVAVREAAAKAVAGGPLRQAVPARVITERLRGHSVVDPAKYRSAEEVERLKHEDPIQIFGAKLTADGVLNADSIAAIEAEVAGDRHRRRRVRREQPAPGGVHAVRLHLRHAGRQRLPPPARPAAVRAGAVPRDAGWSARMSIMTYRQALHDTLRAEMLRDDSVFLMGEEIGVFEGSYKITAGLLKEFGEKRVRDTPIAEEGFAGAAIGAAMLGLRPVVEMMTINFSMLALDQIVNHAAKIYGMFGGQASVPLVIRTPGGGGQQLGATHSQNIELFYAFIPGMKVVAPSSPADAKALLLAAIRDDDPVLFLENLALYNTKGEVPGRRHPGGDRQGRRHQAGQGPDADRLLADGARRGRGRRSGSPSPTAWTSRSSTCAACDRSTVRRSSSRSRRRTPPWSSRTTG